MAGRAAAQKVGTIRVGIIGKIKVSLKIATKLSQDAY
jgi:hypothetical protein